MAEVKQLNKSFTRLIRKQTMLHYQYQIATKRIAEEQVTESCCQLHCEDVAIRSTSLTMSKRSFGGMMAEAMIL